MERKFLEEIKVEDKTLPKEVIDAIFAEYGKSFKEKDEKIATLTTEKDGLSTQLVELNAKVKELSSVDAKKLNEEIENLTRKNEEDTKILSEKLSKQAYDFKVEKLTSGLTFSSESAKKAFIADLSAKELKLEDDKILGFDDFVKSYKENDPKAFMAEDNDGVKTSTGGEHTTTPTDEDARINAIMGLD